MEDLQNLLYNNKSEVNRMKKAIFATVFAMTVVPGFAGAAIPADEVSVAGLAMGESLDYVAEYHGMPDEHERETYIYNKGLQVSFDNGTVSSARISSNQYQSTPAGVTVGTSVDALIESYGKADMTFETTGLTTYVYMANDKSRQLSVEVKDKKVISVTAEVAP